MKTNVVVQSAALTTQVSNRSLSEGSSVYVKVLKNLGGNRFIVSFGGNRFNITSKVPLKEGDSFNAKIKIENQKIFLVQTLESGVQKSVLESIEGLFDSNGKILNPEIIKYFEKLGLFPDAVNYSLFQTLKILGQKFSLPLFNQARKIALRFPGKEAQAAKIVFLMSQKGLTADENTVRSILDSEDFDGPNQRSDFENNKGEGGKTYNGDKSISDEEQIFLVLKNGFDSLLKMSPDKNHPYGVLSLFNHSGFIINGIKNTGNWIKIPFEFDILKNKKLEKGSGSMCFFISSDEKKAKKCSVKLTFFEKNYKFVVSLNEENKKVFVSENMDIQKLQKRFKELDFEYASFFQDEDFPNDEAVLKIVDGRV